MGVLESGRGYPSGFSRDEHAAARGRCKVPLIKGTGQEPVLIVELAQGCDEYIHRMALQIFENYSDIDEKCCVLRVSDQKDLKSLDDWISYRKKSYNPLKRLIIAAHSSYMDRDTGGAPLDFPERDIGGFPLGEIGGLLTHAVEGNIGAADLIDLYCCEVAMDQALEKGHFDMDCLRDGVYRLALENLPRELMRELPSPRITYPASTLEWLALYIHDQARSGHAEFELRGFCGAGLIQKGDRDTMVSIPRHLIPLVKGESAQTPRKKKGRPPAEKIKVTDAALAREVDKASGINGIFNVVIHAQAYENEAAAAANQEPDVKEAGD